MESEGGMGGVIVTLPPMVVYGHGAVGEGFGSISKDCSNGLVPLLHVTKCDFSVSSLEVGRMYHVVAITGCKPSAYPS